MQDKVAILPALATDSKLDLRSIPGPKTLEEKEAFRGSWGSKLLEHAQVQYGYCLLWKAMRSGLRMLAGLLALLGGPSPSAIQPLLSI